MAPSKEAQDFEIVTKSGYKCTGWSYFPPKKDGSKDCFGARSEYLPLIIAIHGGGGWSSFFNLDERGSIVPLAGFLGIPVIAIDRPGYRGSTPLDLKEGDSTITEQGRRIETEVIPAIWDKYAKQLGVNSVVIFGHSVGCTVTTSTASHHGDDHSAYPLAGIVLTACCATSTIDWLTMVSPDRPIWKVDRFSKEMLRLVRPVPFVQDDGLAEAMQRDVHVTDLSELLDIGTNWEKGLGKGLASKVKVPVVYAFGQYDGLWEHGETELFKSWFSSAPSFRGHVIPQCDHSPEITKQAVSWILLEFSAALEMSTAYGITQTLGIDAQANEK